MNAEPKIEQEVSQIDPSENQEVFVEKILSIFKKYSDDALKPLGKADNRANISLNVSLILFGLDVGVFLIYGALQVT